MALKRYEIELVRREVQHGSVEVFAHSISEARQMAKKLAAENNLDTDWTPEPGLTPPPVTTKARIIK